MGNNGLMTGTPFGTGGDPRRGNGISPWLHRPPPADPAESAPAATPAAPAPGTPTLLEQVAETRRLSYGDAAAFELELNEAITGAGAQQAATAPTLDGLPWQRPAAVEPGDLGELANRMHAAREKLASGGRRSGVVGTAGQDAPSLGDLEGMEAQLNALVRQPAAERRATPEKDSLAARVADLDQRAQAGPADPEASFKLDGEIGEVFGELNDEVHAAAAAADTFETYGPRPVQVDEQLLARVHGNPRGASAAEAGSFEAMVNQRVAELAANPELTRPALPSPAPAKPAKQAGQAGDDPLANASPEVLLRVIERLNVSPEQLAGLVAGDEGGEG